MDFQKLHDQLVATGYNDDTADAKIAHDIVLKAIKAAGFRDNLTVKGGVVMSGITDLVRRATMDMDTEQIFVEKLKSLLRIGPASTRFKDVYDMYYLRTRVKLREKDSTGITSRLERIFRDKGFLKGLNAPASTWLDIPAEEATKAVVDFLAKL